MSDILWKRGGFTDTEQTKPSSSFSKVSRVAHSLTVEVAGRDISAHFWDTMVVRRVEALDKRVNEEVMQIRLLMLVEGMSGLTDNSRMILS